jgi:hypothetical protein
MDTRENHRPRGPEPGGAGSAGRRSAIVVGGVGGLAAAIGLRRIGWAVTVLEQAPELRAVGSGWVHTGAEVTGVKEAGDQVSVAHRTAQGLGRRPPSCWWRPTGSTARRPGCCGRRRRRPC